MRETQFDCCFQSDNFTSLTNKKMLVAVSGGSDSLALLYLLNNWRQRFKTAPQFHVATVDHRLRPESIDEAKSVASICKQLDLPHSTLVWKPQEPRGSSADAREGRYAVLCEHAERVGATAIVLGHTMDDQAETVLMRALRGGSTRGLSGMQPTTHYADAIWQVNLLRPLLGIRRQELKDYLATCGITWINDPSNEKHETERVSVRSYLSDSDEVRIVENISRLAHLCSRSRVILSRKTSKFLENHCNRLEVKSNAAHEIQFSLRPSDQHEPIVIAEAFATLIVAAGGKLHRVPVEKLRSIVNAYQIGLFQRIAIGRCLITVGKTGARFEREARNICSFPEEVKNPMIWDNRFALEPDTNGLKIRPFVSGFERFLPASDFPIRRALLNICVDST